VLQELKKKNKYGIIHVSENTWTYPAFCSVCLEKSQESILMDTISSFPTPFHELLKSVDYITETSHKEEFPASEE
jgi:hypothetical protein